MDGLTSARGSGDWTICLLVLRHQSTEFNTNSLDRQNDETT